MTKTSNSNLELKIELRRSVLRSGGLKRLRVLDLFAGGGDIWSKLRGEFRVESYMPCDLKPRMPGTVKANVTPLFVEMMCRSNINVVDIDTYGEPWEIWASVAYRIRRRTAVFLTHGVVGMGQTSNFARQRMGIPVHWKISVKPEVAHFIPRFFLTQQFEGASILAGWTARAGNASYYGLIVDRPSKP